MNRLGLATCSLMAVGVSLALLPGQARAACSQWEMPAKIDIVQSNDAWFGLELTPVEGGFVGKASDPYVNDDTGRIEYVTGMVDGSIEGSTVQFTIHWYPNVYKKIVNSTGMYTGMIGPQGRMTGTGYDAMRPETKANWWGGEVLQCRAAAAPASAPEARPPPVPLGRVQRVPGWFNRADIAGTPWALDDLNTVGWAQAARAANDLCVSKGAGAGHFNGHQDLAKGIFAGQCAKEDAVWRDASAQEISATEWAFGDVNQVSWAQANRAAERLCANANQGFSGGHFNGHQVDGKYGLVCYRGASQWFDASDAELAATGWGFATPKLDDVQWSQAMRAATGFCRSKGFDGGFMNGHQAPNAYGVVCQKGQGY